MRRSGTAVILLGLLIGVLMGCGRGQTPIPPGAQQVHVVVNEAGVHLDPSTVPAGDVFVVLDTPRSSVGFVQSQRGPSGTPGPLSEGDLSRLARGDTEGTGIGGFDLTGCNDAQRAEDLGKMGYCGNVFKVVLTPGKYAFFTGNVDGVPPRSIAVLEVLP